MRKPLEFSLLLSLLASCKDDPKPTPSRATPSSVSSLPSTVASVVVDAAPATAASAPRVVDAGAASDAGAPSCRLVFGPMLQTFRGNGALAATKEGVDVVFNDAGRPAVAHYPGGPIDRAMPVPPLPAAASIGRGAYPPCAAGAGHLYCADKSGAIYRTPRGGGEAHIVARADRGTRIDATTLAGDHAALVYVVSDASGTSEAYAIIDDEAPVRLTPNGSGATTVDIAPRGSRAIALMVDARTATTQIHARPLGLDAKGKVDLGEDVVASIGGPPVRFTAGIAVTAQDGTAFGLVPMQKGAADFGVATIRLDDPPKVEEPMTWSLYPNGLDPAPIAASRGKAQMLVARVRPLARDPSSTRIVDLGRVEKDGSFTPMGAIGGRSSVSDVAMAVDAAGAVWVLYTDAEGSWLERRACG